VKPLRGCLLVLLLVLALSIAGLWAHDALWLEHAQRKQAREFTPGTTRHAIEDALLSKGIRFLTESPTEDFVSAGWEVVPYGPICSPREVGLMLQFEVRNGAPSGADVLQRITPVRQERGCL